MTNTRHSPTIRAEGFDSSTWTYAWNVVTGTTHVVRGSVRVILTYTRSGEAGGAEGVRSVGVPALDMNDFGATRTGITVAGGT